MNIIGGVIVLILAIIFIPVIMTALGDFARDAGQSAQDKQDAKTFGNNPVVGDLVCDVRITAKGELDDTSRLSPLPNPLGNTVLNVFMGDGTSVQEIASYNWQNCYNEGSAPLSWLSPTRAIDELPLQNFGVTIGDSFDVIMEGKSKTNNKVLTEKDSFKIFKSHVKIEDFKLVSLPIQWKADYYLENVKVDDYTIEFSIDGKKLYKGTQQVSSIQFDLLRP